MPRSVVRGVQESLQTIVRAARGVASRVIGTETQADAQEVLRELEQEMWEASEKLEYERAALLRDQIGEWKKTHGLEGPDTAGKKRISSAGFAKKPRWNRKIRA